MTAPATTSPETVDQPATQSDTPSVTGPADVPVAGLCAVCPHPLADHDRIALRFCQATGAQGSSRGCSCR